ncbi:hypothetical protein GUITHDRAFT_136489 [Guillardia theta CCMP2712]|uniref:Tyrosine specific protein phosphatases domain-containing protein n=1 Tax=Guillardia theta (strain CCMP2712) TaxID=905079 RepID=L1JKJ9_GUITC|nr:hypothetical protein GUITHDRAFT_136489 [Guillardia theta CCMP2712]EKX48832.1 hypothetical protein GUITHDRAFT_136489 [Guillardia theta CCMP2712]|eukprot:XP_005835812.1 hypothetical protein GUITHDRAFT_136489 [Guillardia theta CCMP2712]
MSISKFEELSASSSMRQRSSFTLHDSSQGEMNAPQADGTSESLAAPAPASRPRSWSQVKSLWAGQKMRTTLNGFNIDMAYITPHIIALATPVDNKLQKFMKKDSVEEIKQYFEMEHPNKAKFYNLDGETNSSFLKTYEFNGKITQEYAFLKKEVTLLSRIQSFCKDLQTWLDAEDDNVAVIMCASGRNRTGLMICSFLIYAWPNEFQSVREAIEFYEKMRMKDAEAFVYNCHRRYIGYFFTRFAANPSSVDLSKLCLTCDGLDMNKIRIEIFLLNVFSKKSQDQNELQLLWSSKGKDAGSMKGGRKYLIMSLTELLTMAGDIKISGRKFSVGPFYEICSLWFNTGFIDHSPVVWNKTCFDFADQDSKAKVPFDFHLQMLFRDRPRVASARQSSQSASFYCFDCQLRAQPVDLSDSDAQEMDAEGVIQYFRTEAPHRVHPLIDEDCAVCSQRQRKFFTAEKMTASLDSSTISHICRINSMEYFKQQHDSNIGDAPERPLQGCPEPFLRVCKRYLQGSHRQVNDR